MFEDCFHIFGQAINRLLICDIEDVNEATKTVEMFITLVGQDSGNDRTTCRASAYVYI
jgi:hypothetical protein